MKKWIDLYKENISIGEDLKEQVKICKKSTYYELFGTETEKKADLKKLDEMIYKNKFDRIVIIDEVVNELKTEKNKLEKIIKNER